MSRLLVNTRLHLQQLLSIYQIDGVLFEKMQPSGVEVIIGAIDDQQFGKTIMFGMGGIFVEALHDITFKLAPITSM